MHFDRKIPDNVILRTLICVMASVGPSACLGLDPRALDAAPLNPKPSQTSLDPRPKPSTLTVEGLEFRV